jgi:HPt (histidine-containing phosphotransfer) domain-containing protein
LLKNTDLQNYMTRELDRQFLAEYYQGMEDEIGAIFEIFLQEVPPVVAQVTQMLSEEKLSEAKALAHGIIPSFTSVGLPQLSVQLREVEEAAAAADGAGSRLLMTAFEKEFNEYLPAVMAEAERLGKLP